ncbi:MAG TPA: DUF2778 domain-containing protein [Xanthobacteraceae bacterium]
MVLGFILKLPGTQAGPADAGSLRPAISVFGTIHPDIFRLRAPLGAGVALGRVRVASLEPQIRSDAPAEAWSMPNDTSASACPSVSSTASLDERFGALNERSAAFDKRFGAADDCPSSFDESLQVAMRELANSLRFPPAPEVASLQDEAATLQEDAPPKSIVAKPRPRPVQAHRELPQIEDDGRTAIYDISARTVYLPSGRRLEAHSGFGNLMDNPHYVNVRMRGATPPNVYKLTLREQLFHGVRAIRLNPVDGDRMYGRAGILAHTYMLGPNGQSNGCVSFSNYPEFLHAFLRGEITRLAVVDRLDSPPGRLAAGELPDAVKSLMRSTDRSTRYAAAGDR